MTPSVDPDEVLLRIIDEIEREPANDMLPDEMPHANDCLALIDGPCTCGVEESA